MDSIWMALVTAFWLGILTSISPCPLATNIAAVTYIGKQVGRPSTVLLSGIIYTLGRMVTYIGIGIIIISSLLAIPDVAMLLQEYMNRILGPILIIASLFLLGVFKFKLPGFGISQNFQKRVERFGLLGTGLLGILFALSFCPISAGLYFGSLLPLAIEFRSAALMPGVFGLGTALPVVGFSILIAFGARFVGLAFDKLRIFELWARRITGIVFLLVGIYYTLTYSAGIELGF